MRAMIIAAADTLWPKTQESKAVARISLKNANRRFERSGAKVCRFGRRGNFAERIDCQLAAEAARSVRRPSCYPCCKAETTT
jgi:hypothetical protein